MTAPKHVLCGSFDDRNGLLLSARKQLVIRTGANRCKWAKVLFNDHIPDSILSHPHTNVYTNNTKDAHQYRGYVVGNGRKSDQGLMA